VHRRISVSPREVARCTRCGTILVRHRRLDATHLFALTVAAAILFGIATATPVLSIEVGQARTAANVWTAALSLRHGWISVAAIALGATTFLVPMLQVGLLLWVLAFAHRHRRPPGCTPALVALHLLRPWSMTEVFLLGALVAIVKLSAWVHVIPGIGIWALGALTVLLAILGAIDSRAWWDLIESAAG